MYAIVKKDANYGSIKSGKTFVSDIVINLHKGDVYEVSIMDYKGRVAYTLLGNNHVITAMPEKLQEYFDFVDRKLTWKEKRRCLR